MLAVMLNASTPTTPEFRPFNKEHIWSYWQLETAVSLVSDKPFARGDIVDVKETSDRHILMVNPLDIQQCEPAALQGIGFLKPLATDVPLSKDVNFGFKVVKGEAEILRQIRCETESHVSYLLIALVMTPIALIRALDETWGDEFSFIIEAEHEFDNYVLPIRNGLARLQAQQDR